MRRFLAAVFTILFLNLMLAAAMWAAPGTGTIKGTATDTNGGALPGAKIVLTPGNVSAATDEHGNFVLDGVAPGQYKMTVSYVGLTPFETTVTVVAGQVANVNAVLKVASSSQEVVVTSNAVHGETEAINEERTTPQDLDVLPAKVIKALPNANIADAVGRLSGVTLERDEGEGKYVQIRGTEPRLSNLTVDGIEVPSPEGGIRQVKLDTIPADLVQSVQIYKTLEADQPGDAIGGSVNITTKTAGDRPQLSLFGLGGLTPIDNTRSVYTLGGTTGARFGPDHRLGLMVSGSYDFNGRGIDDIEPVPGFNSVDNSFEFTNMDVRQYLYDRKRYGFGTDFDYRLGNNSTFYARSLYSDFKDFGDRNDYALAVNDTIPGSNVPGFTTERRLGDFQIADLILGWDHSSGQWTYRWEGSVARSRMLNPINGDESIVSFLYYPPGTDPVNNPPTSNCQYDATATKNPYLPQFTSACFSEMYNPSNWQLAQTTDPSGTIAIQQANHGRAEQLNLQTSASISRSYFLGSHPGVLQAGFWFTNAHKFDDSWENDYFANGPISASQFVNPSITNSHYYGGNVTGASAPYGPFGPWISWEAINQYLAANPSAFTLSTTQGGNPNNFDLIERITAGYVMNTFNFGRFSLYAGLRLEATSDDTYSYAPGACSHNPLCAEGNNSYISPLPSASLEIHLDPNSDVRLAYGRGISRPDPQFLTAALATDSSYFPTQVTEGNPKLKPEHANNYDLLYERYLNPVGIIRGGFFYKDISTPIVTLLTNPAPSSNCVAAGVAGGSCQIVQAANAGSAYITGVELSFEQHFTYLPGPLRGLGILADYSHAWSQANNVNPGLRADNPALLRQAPDTFNILPTYDYKRLSVGAGFAYNGANIYAYGFTPCQVQSGSNTTAGPVDSNGNCQNGGTPTPGGLYGPFGDNYLFSHLQVDAQASVYLGKGLTFMFNGLNLNNEVFGFYNGSPHYFVQREYYKPTYSFGFRWDLHHE